MTSSPSSISIARIFNLDDAQGAELGAFAETLHLTRGEYLYREEELSRGAYLVLDGELALQHRGVMVKIVRRGESLAEASLLLCHRCLNSAVALSDCQVQFLSHANLLKLRAHHPGLTILALTSLQARLAALTLSTLKNLLRIEENRDENARKDTQ